MSARGPTGFYMQVDPAGALLLRGELDPSTVQDLQDKLDEIMIPGQPVVMDLAQLTFLDSSAIECLFRTWYASGHPVILHNATPAVHRFLDLARLQPEAWVFDGEGRIPART
jgi:anti-anti-sigma factor